MSVSSARFWIANPVIQRDTVSGAILKWLAKVRCEMPNCRRISAGGSRPIVDLRLAMICSSVAVVKNSSPQERHLSTLNIARDVPELGRSLGPLHFFGWAEAFGCWLPRSKR